MTRNMGFIQEEKRLSLREGFYWEKLFKENIVIGTEIEVMFKNERINTSAVERMIRDGCGEGSNPGDLRCPVEEVKSDGSLSSGAEILTPGRRFHSFLQMFSQYKMIYDSIASEEPIIDQRMGWHNHILLSNYNRVAVAEMPVPNIILKNLLSLCKYYYPALVFISSTTPDKGVYTRYNSFCVDNNLKKYDPTEEMKITLERFHNRYNAINLNPISIEGTNRDGDLRDFHVEFRFPDGNVSPVLMTSLNVLYKAIVIKAVKLSKFGLIDTPDFDERIKDLYYFKNNGSMFNDGAHEVKLIEMTGEDYRTVKDRQSQPLLQEHIEDIRELSVELVEFLESEIDSIDPIAVHFLKMFATKPVSEMFDELETDDIRIIEDLLEDKLDDFYVKEDPSLLPLIEIIESRKIESASYEEWKEKASEMISYKGSIDEAIGKLKSYAKVTYVKGKGLCFN